MCNVRALFVNDCVMLYGLLLCVCLCALKHVCVLCVMYNDVAWFDAVRGCCSMRVLCVWCVV